MRAIDGYSMIQRSSKLVNRDTASGIIIPLKEATQNNSRVPNHVCIQTPLNENAHNATWYFLSICNPLILAKLCSNLIYVLLLPLAHIAIRHFIAHNHLNAYDNTCVRWCTNLSIKANCWLRRSHTQKTLSNT